MTVLIIIQMSPSEQKQHFSDPVDQATYVLCGTENEEDSNAFSLE